jgi:prephenate dehydrogenase
VLWNKITLVGVGLLGGSLGLAVKHRRLARMVAGYVRREASIRECEKVGAVDFATTDLLAAVWGADLVILCTPLGQMRSLVKQLLPALKRGAIVTDVGSVKASVVNDVELLIKKAGAHFIGGHPMAGGEQTGVSAARADLFESAMCVVTPTQRSHRAGLRKVAQFWKNVGGRVLSLSPDRHDALVGRSSHLPHLLAATLAASVLDPKHPKQQAALCATGFRDTTRIASGSPEMWRDIALANRAQLRLALDEFVRELQGVQKVLRRGKAAEVEGLFLKAKERRDRWRARCVSPSAE